jgi:hypothetical protein
VRYRSRRRPLSVRQAVVAVGYEVIESTPKSHNARVIDLDHETVALLREYRRKQADERAEWGTDYEDHDLVAAKEDGSPIHRTRSARCLSGWSNGPASERSGCTT